MATLTIDDIVLSGKRALIRVDFNVPMTPDLKVADDTRIVGRDSTIRKVLDDGGCAVLMSHLGRPKGKPTVEFSLKPVADYLAGLLAREVKFAPDCVGAEADALATALQPGEVLLLENLRFYAEEEKNDPGFAKKLARFGDVYVNDAFGSAHRAHASTEGVTHFLKPAVAGYLMRKEIEYLTRAVGNPARPYLAILGGAKISGKIDVIQNLLPSIDALVIGGGMAFTFFQAQGYEIGDSLVEQDRVGMAREILEESKTKKTRLILPVDCVVAGSI